jgi:diguanylate cyclase
VAPQLHDDPLTGLYSRIGLETILWEWWQQGRHQSRQMTAALFDLDGFGQINEKHGSLIGDRILHHVGRHIRNATTDADLVARFAGQRFLVLMLDVGPRTGIKNAETIRQSIGEITFFNREKKIRLTTAGGITEVTPDDTHEALFERLEETLRQAKQTGPDRSFFHGGTKPELVRSPILVTEGTEISL